MSNNELEIVDALRQSSGGNELNLIMRARALDRIASQAREAAEAQGKNPELAAHRAVAPGKLAMVAPVGNAADDSETALGNLVNARFDQADGSKGAATE